MIARLLDWRWLWLVALLAGCGTCELDDLGRLELAVQFEGELAVPPEALVEGKDQFVGLDKVVIEFESVELVDDEGGYHEAALDDFELVQSDGEVQYATPEQRPFVLLQSETYKEIRVRPRCCRVHYTYREHGTAKETDEEGNVKTKDVWSEPEESWRAFYSPLGPGDAMQPTSLKVSSGGETLQALILALDDSLQEQGEEVVFVPEIYIP